MMFSKKNHIHFADLIKFRLPQPPPPTVSLSDTRKHGIF